MSKKKPYFTFDYQFAQAETALKEARNLHKARYWTSCISQAYHVAYRCAAALLFGIEVKIATEREVGAGFEAAFVTNHHTDPKFGAVYKRLYAMRQRSDFEHDYVAQKDEADEALRLAEEFHAEALRLRGLQTGPPSPL